VCLPHAQHSVAWWVVFGSVSLWVCVCVCQHVNSLTVLGYHRESFMGRYRQMLGRVWKWLHSDALRWADGDLTSLMFEFCFFEYFLLVNISSVIDCLETVVLGMSCYVFSVTVNSTHHGLRHGWSMVGKGPPWKKSGWAWPTLEILAVVWKLPGNSLSMKV